MAKILKISDIIKQLEKIKSVEGDLVCFRGDFNEETEINTVKVKEADEFMTRYYGKVIGVCKKYVYFDAEY